MTAGVVVRHGGHEGLEELVDARRVCWELLYGKDFGMSRADSPHGPRVFDPYLLSRVRDDLCAVKIAECTVEGGQASTSPPGEVDNIDRVAAAQKDRLIAFTTVGRRFPYATCPTAAVYEQKRKPSWSHGDLVLNIHLIDPYRLSHIGAVQRLGRVEVALAVSCVTAH